MRKDREIGVGRWKIGGEVRSLLYVNEDNYPAQGRTAGDARILVPEVGRLATGLISSTRKRLAVKISACAVSLATLGWACFHLLG